VLEEVRYRRCPDCDEVMDRMIFARVSGVMIDVCRRHGAFLDTGELKRIRRFLAEDGPRRHAVARELAVEEERLRERRRPPPPPMAQPPRPLWLELLELLLR